jgi:hypothetical protein
MGSSFLTAIDLGLGLYCAIIFMKFLIQFGLPNHPGRFFLYMVTFSVTAFFVMRSMADLWIYNPFLLTKWQAFPVVAGSLGLLLQVVTVVGQYSLVQQKIISRLPLIAALLFFSLFENYAFYFFGTSLFLTGLFLSVSVGKARYQKRQLTKMIIFFLLAATFSLAGHFTLYVLGQVFLFPALFYFFLFQQSYGVSTLVEEHMAMNSGVPT